MSAEEQQPGNIVVVDDVSAADELLRWPAEESSDDCIHNYLTATILDGEIIGQNCMMCWLPVGVPCSPERATINAQVETELLAAKIARLMVEGHTILAWESDDFQSGWRAWHGEDSPQTSETWHAGWLAAEILFGEDNDAK